MKLELILKDGTSVDLIEANYPKHYVLECKNAAAFKRVWNKMTDENTSEIHIKEDDEEKAIVVGSRVCGTQTVTISDSLMYGHFYLDRGDVYGPGEYPPVFDDETNGDPEAVDGETEPVKEADGSIEENMETVEDTDESVEEEQ